VSAPIDTPTLSPFPILPLAHSLRNNGIGAEGATALAAILNENTKLINLNLAWNGLSHETKKALKDAARSSGVSINITF